MLKSTTDTAEHLFWVILRHPLEKKIELIEQRMAEIETELNRLFVISGHAWQRGNTLHYQEVSRQELTLGFELSAWRELLKALKKGIPVYDLEEIKKKIMHEYLKGVSDE